jgi:hypothetical protein
MNLLDEHSMAVVERVVNNAVKRAIQEQMQVYSNAYAELRNQTMGFGPRLARLDRAVFGEGTNDDDGGMMTDIRLMKQKLNGLVLLLYVVLLIQVVELLAIVVLAIIVI